MFRGWPCCPPPTEDLSRLCFPLSAMISIRSFACSAGQCTLACPTGAITERDDTRRVWDALADPEMHVVVQTAPAIRASLGEELGLPAGTVVTGKLVAALRRLGFDRVFDTDFTADLTIMEEGHELLERIEKGNAPLPLLTSCSPGWINFIERFYPDLLPHVSTCKSPSADVRRRGQNLLCRAC